MTMQPGPQEPYQPPGGQPSSADVQYYGVPQPQHGAPQAQYAPVQPQYPPQNYGTPPQTVYVYNQPAPGNGFAVASLVLAIVGIVVGIIPFFIGLFLSFVPCLLGILFGILGIVRSNQLHGRGFGMALAGLIIAGINFLLWFTGYGILW